MLKVSVSNIAWSTQQDEEMYGFLRQNGFDGLEIAPTRIFSESPYSHLEEACAFAKSLMETHHLAISSMQSIWFGKTQSIFGPDEDREALVEYTRRAVDFARSMGCGNLVFGCPKNRILPEGRSPHEAHGFFSSIVQYAGEHNTVIALEANPTLYGTNFINTTSDAFACVRAVDLPGFLVNVDLGTILYNGESLSPVLEHLPLVNHIHISEPGLEPVKKRPIHEELASRLREAGYEGYISLEMKNPGDLAQVQEAASMVREVFQ